MRNQICFVLLMAAGLSVPAARADIYSWVDENGVRHISNTSPPPHAQVFLRTEERPPEDIRPTGEAQRLAELRRAEVELRRREERLARQAAALERRIEAAEEKAREALEAAEDRLAAVEARRAAAWQRQSYGLVVTYVARPFDHRHDGRKHRRHHPGRRYQPPSFAGHPFYLGAIHRPLFSTRDYIRRPPADSARFGNLRPSGGKHGQRHRRR